MAQQPPPLSARRAERLLLVGIRSDVVRDPLDAGDRPRMGRPGGAEANLRRSARPQSAPRREPGADAHRARADLAGTDRGDRLTTKITVPIRFGHRRRAAGGRTRRATVASAPAPRP